MGETFDIRDVAAAAAEETLASVGGGEILIGDAAGAGTTGVEELDESGGSGVKIPTITSLLLAGNHSCITAALAITAVWWLSQLRGVSQLFRGYHSAVGTMQKGSYLLVTLTRSRGNLEKIPCL